MCDEIISPELHLDLSACKGTFHQRFLVTGESSFVSMAQVSLFDEQRMRRRWLLGWVKADRGVEQTTVITDVWVSGLSVEAPDAAAVLTLHV